MIYAALSFYSVFGCCFSVAEYGSSMSAWNVTKKKNPRVYFYVTWRINIRVYHFKHLELQSNNLLVFNIPMGFVTIHLLVLLNVTGARCVRAFVCGCEGWGGVCSRCFW